MGRPIYPHEMGDPDFFWLISSFRESHPDFTLIEMGSLPMVLIHEDKPPEIAGVPVAPELAQAEPGDPLGKKI